MSKSRNIALTHKKSIACLFCTNYFWIGSVDQYLIFVKLQLQITAGMYQVYVCTNKYLKYLYQDAWQ